MKSLLKWHNYSNKEGVLFVNERKMKKIQKNS